MTRVALVLAVWFVFVHCSTAARTKHFQAAVMDKEESSGRFLDCAHICTHTDIPAKDAFLCYYHKVSTVLKSVRHPLDAFMDTVGTFSLGGLDELTDWCEVMCVPDKPGTCKAVEFDEDLFVLIDSGLPPKPHPMPPPMPPSLPPPVPPPMPPPMPPSMPQDGASKPQQGIHQGELVSSESGRVLVVNYILPMGEGIVVSNINGDDDPIVVKSEEVAHVDEAAPVVQEFRGKQTRILTECRAQRESAGEGAEPTCSDQSLTESDSTARLNKKDGCCFKFAANHPEIKKLNLISASCVALCTGSIRVRGGS